MTDKEIKKLWNELEDVPFDENENSELVLAQDWYIFPKGTDRETIWHWFDKNYSKGVYELLYERK